MVAFLHYCLLQHLEVKSYWKSQWSFGVSELTPKIFKVWRIFSLKSLILNLKKTKLWKCLFLTCWSKIIIVAKGSWNIKPTSKNTSEVHSAVHLFITYQSLDSSLFQTVENTFGNLLLIIDIVYDINRLDQKFAHCNLLRFVIILIP